MSVYGFNDNLEKVQIITLTATITFNAAENTHTWNTAALTAAGIDANNLNKYAVLDVIQNDGGNYWHSGQKTGPTSSTPGLPTFPIVTFETNSKAITITDYDSGTATKSYKVRLMKVE